MRIYVASSWRNELQPKVVQLLRSTGHQVYDFFDSGFGWLEIASAEALNDPKRFRDQVLRHDRAYDSFRSDMGALLEADVLVLVLPCGRSAHLELGVAIGRGKRTIILLDDPLSEPELMYLAASKLCTSFEELAAEVSRAWPLARERADGGWELPGGQR